MKVKRLLVILTVLMITAVSANAQNRYSADVDFGYTLGFEKWGLETNDRIHMTTTHGVMFDEKLFVGAGVGVEYAYDSEFWMLPLYSNVKGFLAVSNKTSLFASVDLGYLIYLSEYSEDDAFYFCPGVGVKVGKLKLQAGYSLLSDKITFGGMQFKVGFIF